MQHKQANKQKPKNKNIFIIIGVLLFILSRSWVSDQITNRKDKDLFNLIFTTALFVFMFIVCYYKTKAGEYIKFRPLVYVGVLVYLAFVIYFFYSHFTT